MSDRMAAEIWIGGKMPRSLLEEFGVADLCTDWESEPLGEVTEAKLQEVLQDGLLHFAEPEASWGEFEIESWLREHNIPFHRQSEGKYEYDPCLVAFRPDLPQPLDCELTQDHSGHTGVVADDLRPTLAQMQELYDDKEHNAAVDPYEQLSLWAMAFSQLKELLPPEIPPLPPFEIVEDTE